LNCNTFNNSLNFTSKLVTIYVIIIIRFEDKLNSIFNWVEFLITFNRNRNNIQTFSFINLVVCNDWEKKWLVSYFCEQIESRLFLLMNSQFIVAFLVMRITILYICNAITPFIIVFPLLRFHESSDLFGFSL
jgi:hypothetical protein